MKRRAHRPDFNPEHSRDPAVVEIRVIAKKQRQTLTIREPRNSIAEWLFISSDARINKSFNKPF